MAKTTEVKKVGLIRGRHEMPVSEYIFSEIEDVFDFTKMEKVILNFLEKEVGITTTTRMALNQYENTDVECFCGSTALVVYVTGLTSVTAALIKCCALNGVQLTLMHFNNATGEYEEQFIF